MELKKSKKLRQIRDWRDDATRMLRSHPASSMTLFDQ